MRQLGIAVIMGLLSLGNGIAQTLQSVNIRGTVTAFDAKIISIDSRDAGPVQVALPDNVNVSGTKAITMADIKPGMVLGVTTIKRADGETVAIDIRPIPASARVARVTVVWSKLRFPKKMGLFTGMPPTTLSH